MTKKEFYSLIDEFIQAGYNEDSVIKLKWATKPSSKWERCGIPAREGDTIEIKWYKEDGGYVYDDKKCEWVGPGWTETGIEFMDYGTWYADSPRRFAVVYNNTKHRIWNHNYTAAEEVLEGFEEDYGQAYRYWEMEA